MLDQVSDARMPRVTASQAAGSRRLSPWLRRLRNLGIVVTALIALYAIIGFFVVPSIARSQFESTLSRELGRQATLRKVEFNPFTLRARLSDFALANREATGTFASFETLEVDVSSASIRYLAPVFDAIRLVRPKIELVRDAQGTYSIQDLIERAAAQPSTSDARAQFSLNNIEIDEGTFSLDDRPGGRTINVANIGIGIPFLSSLAHDAEIRVTPRLDGAIDGARFELKGTSTTPFADVQEATLDLDLDRMALAQYAQYWPLPSGLKLVDGALTTRLRLAFTTERRTPRSITVAGTARIDGPAIARRDGSALISAGSAEVAIEKLDPIARVLALDRVAIDALRADVRRVGGGEFELVRLLSSPASTAQTTSTAELPATADRSNRPPASAWRVSITDLHASAHSVDLADETVTPAFKTTLGNLRLNAKHVDSDGPGSFDATFDTDSGAHFEGRAEANLSAKSARGHFALTGFRLDRLYPYYANALNVEVRRGALDLNADVDVAVGNDGADVKLADGTATLNDVEMALREERDPLWRVPRADLTGVAFDLKRRNIAIDRIQSAGNTIRIVRQRDGAVDFERIVKTRTGRTPDAASGVTTDQGWSYAVRKLSFERATAAFEDRVPQPPVKLRIDANVSADNFGNAHGLKGTVDIAARLPPTGRVNLAGALATNPVAFDWRVDATGVNLVPLRPYYEARTNITVTHGAAAAKGRVVYAAAQGSASRVSYKGDITISDFASLDRPTSQELLRWKTLSLRDVDAASQPHKLAIGSIALDKYYARIIVNPDATLNLQKLLSPEATEDEAPTTSVRTTAPAATATTATAAPAKATAAKAMNANTGNAKTPTRELPAASAPERELPVSIGRIGVSDGNVEFSDFFVKPNYSANLTNVTGSVSALSATQAGQVELSGRVANTAPVELRGAINPFARELTLDLTAKATDIDLPPLTPYSAKYAGYGIQKGKLSFEAHYAIDQRKLAATNKLVLDQLTFGEHVDSPTATKLPVRLAVALLKDRNGRIDLDLPIQGTLDDPKFSVWRIIVQIIGNLITKVVTAPFAVLGALAGGGGEQLAYVEFAPGHSDISAAAEAKLRSLAKALADRPALKLDATGRAVPDVDREGLKRAALERAMRVQKQKSLRAEESAPSAQDTMTIDVAEYPVLLKAVYRDTKLADKPRNLLGMEKDIPPAEMEGLLLASYGADDGALRDLANRRAEAVKEWLVDQGEIPAERVFVVAPKLTGDGIEDKGAATRVDFSIK